MTPTGLLPKKTATTIDPLLWGPLTVAPSHPSPEKAPEVPSPLDVLDRRSGAAFLGYKWGKALIIAAIGLVIYEVLGRTELHRSPTLLMTALDRRIPLLPWTAWFYEPFYVSIFIIGVMGFRSRFLYDRTLICVCANIVLAALGHFFVRAEYPRPILPVPSPDLSVALLAWVYRIDPSGNVFPSLHVAHTFVITLLLAMDRPRLGRVLLVMSILLAISTLTTKQHFIADVAAGLVMGFGARYWTGVQLARALSAARPARPR
jgi:membrane-associated phospholipid phosphatase